MKDKLKKFLIPISLSVFVLACSVLGFSGALKQKSGDKTYSKWMESLSDLTLLRTIAMPGSHDTMALHSIGDLAGQCQSLSLEDQLNLGVRFLDIRLKEDKNELKAVHGFVDQKAKFDSITKTIEKFIEDNPSEFIIMSVKEEDDPSFSTISFEDCLKGYLKSDIYWKNDILPLTLGQVRGKVLLLSRYASPTIGINAYDGWADSCSFTLSKHDIYVQDTYKITSSEDKKEEIKKCFNEIGHMLKINFLSAYRTDYFPPSYAPSAALDINPWINDEISNYKDRGIVLYDFVTKASMDSFFEGIL